MAEKLPEPPEPRQADERIEDPDGYNVKKSLERLQHRRDILDQVQDFILQVQLENPNGHIPRQALKVYRQAVEAAITAFKPHLQNEDLDTEHDYWDEYPLGEMKQQPPAELTQKSMGDLREGGRGVREPAEEQQLNFLGLRDIWEAPEELNFEFNARFQEPVQPAKLQRDLPPNASILTSGKREFTPEVSVVVTKDIPLDVLNGASAALAEFSQEIGIDARLDEGRGDGQLLITMPKDWKDTELYRDWYNAVVRPPRNDFVMLVTASSRSPVSGTGKSTLLTNLARRTDLSETGYSAEEKATVDVRELAYEPAPNSPTRSALVADEIQGLVGSEGFDRRRAMKESVIDGINSILANRNKSYTIILGAQRLPYLDSRIPPIVDAWLLIRKAPGQAGGPVGTYHRIHTADYEIKSPQIRTPGIEDFTWEPVPHDDPDYATLEELKEERKTKQPSDGGEETKSPKQLRNERIQTLYENGVTQPKIAESFDLDQSQVSRIVNSS